MSVKEINSAPSLQALAVLCMQNDAVKFCPSGYKAIFETDQLF